MTPSKLILVEGVPGSGKTTMAGFVAHWLEQNGFRSRLYCEGDLDHPADYESAAYFTPAEYAAFLQAHPRQRDQLARYSTMEDGGHFLRYAEMAEAETVPQPLIAELARCDVYELDLATHQRLIRQRWRRFVERAQAGDEVFVFECCFLQNPLTMTSLKYNRPDSEGLAYVQTIADRIRPLSPILVYLSNDEIPATLARVARERRPEWREGVGAYTDRGAWAQATGHAGFEGFVAWLEMRQAVERSYLAQSGLTHLVVDVTGQDWDAYQRQVAAFLRSKTIDVSV